MNSPRSRQDTLLDASVFLCFVLSGAAGLVYQIVWMRLLGLIFGHTVFAVATVLAAFMAGLAFGAWLFGRLIDQRGRPLRVYGLIEGAVGLYVLLVPALFAGAQAVYVWLYRALGLSFVSFSLAQFVLVFLILLPPTTLMGASLPVLARFFVRRLEGLGRKVADLYALNTLGAVLGAAATGFFLLPAVGVRAATALAAAINIGVAAWALAADRWGRQPHGAPPVEALAEALPPEMDGTEPAQLVTWLVLSGAGLAGAASMIYEVAWSRALRLVVGSSVYAFSAMLVTFLAGLALGSLLFARIWGRRRPHTALFGWLEVGVGLTALALVPAFGWLPDLVLAIFRRVSPSPGGALLTQFALSLLVMIVPTTLMGAAFPCAVQLCARALPRLGRDVGRVYSVNTVGAIAGALLGGFLLVPWLGAETAVKAAAGLNTAVGVAALAAGGGRAIWPRAGAVAVVLLFTAGMIWLPGWDRQIMMGGVSIYAQRFVSEADPTARFRREVASRQLLFYREGINSTVAVERTERMTSLRVDGKVDASNGADMMTQLMLGHLPMLLHPLPERILVIGLGSGVTAAAVAQHPVARQINVVELEPAVVEASRFFLRENRGVLDDPRVRVVLGDGRNFILGETGRYDVITSEPSNPWMAGVANLFSLEFYRLARERLAEDGIMVQWVHGYSLFPRELRMVAQTFRQVFPHSTLWRTIRGDYLLVGMASPLRVDYGFVTQRIAAAATVREDLAAIRLDSPLDLLTLFLLDEAALARFADGAPVNTDNRPLLEFAAPLALYAETTEENARLLRKARGAEFPTTANVPAGLLEARRVHFARAFWARGEREEAVDQLRKAPPAPGDLASRLERAKLLFSLGYVAEASEILAGLPRERPHDRLVISYLRVGTIVRRLGTEEALARHSQTQHGDPNPAEAHNNLGVFYTRLGVRFGEPAFFDLAVDALEAARQIEPQAYAVINNLGNAQFELGRLEEAEQAYLQVVRLLPGLAEARFNLGLVYEKKGMRELAAREFQAASALKPEWTLPRLRLQRSDAGPSPHGESSARGGAAR